MSCPLGESTSLSLEGVLEYITCSGNGRCLSLRQVATIPDYKTTFNSTVYSDWDADRIHGCVCDDGWQGIACEDKSCPWGDDPMTSGVDEVQLIDCQCTTCMGGVTLVLRGKETDMIPYNAGPALIKYKLQVGDD